MTTVTVKLQDTRGFGTCFVEAPDLCLRGPRPLPAPPLGSQLWATPLVLPHLPAPTLRGGGAGGLAARWSLFTLNLSLHHKVLVSRYPPSHSSDPASPRQHPGWLHTCMGNLESERRAFKYWLFRTYSFCEPDQVTDPVLSRSRAGFPRQQYGD